MTTATIPLGFVLDEPIAHPHAKALWDAVDLLRSEGDDWSHTYRWLHSELSAHVNGTCHHELTWDEPCLASVRAAQLVRQAQRTS